MIPSILCNTTYLKFRIMPPPPTPTSPPPKKKPRKIAVSQRSTFWPCGSCRQNCKTDCIQCDACKQRYHAQCEDLSVVEENANVDECWIHGEDFSVYLYVCYDGAYVRQSGTGGAPIKFKYLHKSEKKYNNSNF